MSSYPAPKNSGLGIYNSGSFLGLDDIGGGQRLVLDLANYVRSDAASFTGNIQTTGSLVLGNTVQSVAFSDAKNTILLNVDQRTSDISYASNQTTVSGDFSVSGALIIPDDSLSIAKISTLQTHLDQIDENITQIQANDLDISGLQTFQATQELVNTSTDNSLATINTALLTHDDELSTINGVLSTHNSHLSALDSTTAAATSSISTINSQITVLQSADASTATLITALQEKDTSLDSDISAINTSIAALQTKDGQLDTEIAAINADITNLEAADVTLQTNITANDNAITSINGSIASINESVQAHSEMLESLETLTDSHTTSIADLETSSAAHGTQIGDLETLTTAHTASISSISTQQDLNTSEIDTKQAILNSSNRLDAAYIGDGSISNGAFQTLYGINTGSSIESRLTALSNTLNGLDIDVSTLETLQNIDLSTFNTIGTQLTTIESDVSTNTSDIAASATDIGNLQSNVASNTGRLNVIDSTLTTIQSNVSTNSGNISTNTSDIGTLESNVATNTADILTKQNIINSGNKLAASVVSTNVDSTPSTLDLILQSLTDINATQSSTISSINDSITSLTNDIATNETSINSLLTADTTHSNAISTNSADIVSNAAAIALKQDIISGSNLLSSAYITDTNEADTLDNIIVRIDGDIATKQDILNDTSNKLPIDYVDISSSNIRFADYGSSISTKLDSLDGQISTLTTLQNGDIANFTAIDDNFTEIDAHLLTLDGQVANYTYLANVTSDVQQQIDNISAASLPSMSYDSGTTTTTISNTTQVTTLKFSGDSTTQTTAFTGSLKSDLEANTASVATLTSSVSANTSAISGKQDTLNDTSNKLPIDYVDISASNIRFADFGSSINSKFTAIDSTLSSQATTNSSVAGDLSTLSSGKQDVLSSGNKLNPEYIATSGAGTMTSTKFQYLTSIDADIATKFTGKADIDGPTFTGVVTIPNLTMTGPFVCKSIAEKIASTFTSFSSNILTADFTNNSILYWNGLTASTNFKMALTSVPTTTYQTQTFSLIIGVGTYKAFANTCSINGSDITLVAAGGLANIDLTDLTTSGCLLQQFTVIYLNSGVFKVITNVSSFY
jgi:predicted  nucleic acid-binding Zn-ribbon protein